MADLSPSGKPVDDRAQAIARRRKQHQLHTLEVSVEKYEIDIMDREDDIVRLREAMEANGERIKTLRAELDGKPAGRSEKKEK